MTLTQLRGQWDLQSGSAAGCSNYGCYTFNPKFLVHVVRECELFVRLQVVKGSTARGTPPAINVAVFESTAEGDLMLSSNPKTAFRGASSEDGVYAAGNTSGVTTKKRNGATRFPPGWYIVLPSTFEPHHSAFELKIFASQQVEVRSL